MTQNQRNFGTTENHPFCSFAPHVIDDFKIALFGAVGKNAPTELFENNPVDLFALIGFRNDNLQTEFFSQPLAVETLFCSYWSVNLD